MAVCSTLEVAPLDPALAGLLAQMAAQGNPPLEALPPAVGRRIYRDMDAALGLPAPVVGKVEDLVIEGPGGPLALRAYAPATPGPWPVLMFLHGGGFVIGDLDTHDKVCRTLCHHAHMLVVAVDYRLAPEHPFPAAPDDAEAALRWLCAHAATLGGDASRMAVAGDSAGAQLALVAVRRVGGIQALGMIYPAAQHPDTPSPSYAENGEGKFLTYSAMRWFMATYLGGQAAAAQHPDFDLLHSDMAALPPTWVATMGHDPLRDEGHALALRIEHAGVAVAHAHYPGAIHACIHFSGVSTVGAQVVVDLAAWLRLQI
ncbi:MAG: alpha/beta hydrolase [Rhodoferax sp.]|uniref:alpha/beta hydrolase n=3 Tax=Rhodoferax sp. TaxID=50421 RepID=UPI003264CA9D